MTKEQQLQKTKQPNAKKMSPIELANYKNFIYALQGGVCYCGCNEPIDDFHHSTYNFKNGGKDDRYLIGVSRPTHHTIHNGMDKEERVDLNERAIEKSKEIWGKYTL